MPPHLCELCQKTKAQILRPKNHARLCAPCFTNLFESEIAQTITEARLFHPGERIAIGASGGKDSTVLASVLKTLNDRHEWNLELILLSIDEGITGYRDHSLDAVRRNAKDLGLQLKILSYEELYGWSMDQVVEQIGRKGNCTYCGVFRRQALDRGAALLGVRHVVTGHNVDDVAETVVMNLLRGDLARLSRGTSIVTSTPSATARDGGEEFTRVKRSKPLMFAYEKEIVLYAHHKRLDYFSTECVYSPEAFRGSARTLIKNLERIRPESILDVVKSGMDMARLVPGAAEGEEVAGVAAAVGEEEAEGGCGNQKHGDGGGAGEMARMEAQLRQNERAELDGIEMEVTLPVRAMNGNGSHAGNITTINSKPDSIIHTNGHTLPLRSKDSNRPTKLPARDAPKQKLGQCQRCGYLSSQAICKACVLLEGLNKARPKTEVQVGDGGG